jgi:hypothetical protein
MSVPAIANTTGLQGRRGDAERFRLAIIFFHLFPSLQSLYFYFITNAGVNSFFMWTKGCLFVPAASRAMRQRNTVAMISVYPPVRQDIRGLAKRGCRPQSAGRASLLFAAIVSPPGR